MQAKCLYSGKSGCIRAKSLCSDKVVVLGQSCCILGKGCFVMGKVLNLGKVVRFGKSGFIPTKVVLLG